MCLRVS